MAIRLRGLGCSAPLAKAPASAAAPADSRNVRRDIIYVLQYVEFSLG